jgi:hypothetical protein
VVTRSPILAAGVLACAAAIAAAGCRKIPPEPLKLEGNLLTVDNRTSQEWSNVEIWLNTYYRITVSSIPPGGRLQAPLDMFVAGLGQRFDVRRAQIHSLRLTAKLPDGKPFELNKQFEGDGLADALGGIGKTR